MNAKLGSYPSYTWRSIWGARELLKEGIGWRIGNGERVNIWDDSWIPGPRDGRVNSQTTGIRFVKVSTLIDSEKFTWQKDAVEELFDEGLASLV